MNSDSMKLTVGNGAGLDIDAGVDAVVAATAIGNQEVRLNGVDHDGNKLSGNNQQFHISAPVVDMPSTDLTLRERLYEAFRRLMRRGTIRGADLEAQGERMRDLERRR